MNIRVIIDNGHGVNTPGKCSPDGTFKEWVFNRLLANKLSDALFGQDIDNTLLVPEDIDISLPERCRRVKTLCAGHEPYEHVLVSIHVNACYSGDRWGSARGWRGFTYIQGSQDSYLLSNCFKDRLKNEFNLYIPFNPGCIENKCNFYILKHTPCPAILTENLFMDNHDDLAFLRSEDGQKWLVDLHVSALKEYIDCVADKYNLE